MSHPTATPDAVVEAYVATWNETDPARRRAGLAAAWTETGIYRDPVMAGDGSAGIDAMLAGVQAKFPGFVLKRTSTVDAHGGPPVVEGVDFCILGAGRPARVRGRLHRQDAGVKTRVWVAVLAVTAIYHPI